MHAQTAKRAQQRRLAGAILSIDVARMRKEARDAEHSIDAVAYVRGSRDTTPGTGSLALLHQAANHLAAATDIAIAIARNEGTSFGQIGRKLGISPQAARQRYLRMIDNATSRSIPAT